MIIIGDLQDICIELKNQGVNLNQALRFVYQYGDNTELMKDVAKEICLNRVELREYLKGNYEIEIPRNTKGGLYVSIILRLILLPEV